MRTTIEENHSEGRGGGIQSGGDLTLADSKITGNTALRGGGVHLWCDNTIVTNTTISGSTAVEAGGGMSVSLFQADLIRSTVSGNRAGTTGGGIHGEGSVALTNSTVSGNDAAYGGGIWQGSNVLLRHSTVTANVATGPADASGGGILVSVGRELVLRNTIVVANAATLGPDCRGNAVLVSPISLIGDLNECTTRGRPLTGNPMLAPLGNNGGLTQTHALLPGSPAIDAGYVFDCDIPWVGRVDQRRFVRPHGPACDLGAYEAGAVPANFFADFESAILEHWLTPGRGEGIARVEARNTCFGANNTMGINFNGKHALNIRSSPNAPLGSVGVATSGRFVLGTSVSFHALAENDDAIPALDPVTFEVRILGDGGGILATHPVRPNIVTTSPGTSNDGCLVGEWRDREWSAHTIDTTAFAGQIGRVEFRQHTNVPGKGFFTLIDDVIALP